MFFNKRVLLCCHTGSRNRGCEAIVRCTSELLQKVGVEPISMTFDIAGDYNVGLEKSVSLLEYPRKNQMQRAISLIMRKVKGNDLWGSSFYQKEIKENYNKYDAIFNVGGDTYCYTTPWISISANLEAKKLGLKTVFWGCSIDERLDYNKVLQEDISRYDFIVARESYSFDILKRNYRGNGVVYQACDPAFHLQAIETSLPNGFLPGNTVGINISPVMVDINNISNSIIIQNCITLIRDICDKTDMNICLIPHVYQIEPQDRDYKVLSELYEVFKNNPRVSLVNRELSAGELK